MWNNGKLLRSSFRCTDEFLMVFCSVIAVLYPILAYYGFGSLNFGLLSVVSVLLCFFLKKKHLIISHDFFFIGYFVYFMLTRAFFSSSISEMIAPSIIYMVVYFGLLNRNINFDLFLRVYRIVAIVSIVFFIIQEFMFYTLGYRIPGLFTFLPITLAPGDFDAESWSESVSIAPRSTGFFSEPAHFVQFLLPLLAVELLYVANKKSMIRSFVYVLTLVWLSSGNALLGLAIIFLFFVPTLLKKLHPFVSFIIVIVSLVVFPLFSHRIMNSEYGEKMLDRQEEIAPNQGAVSSGFIRIFRGFYIWDELSSSEKVFGLNSVSKIKNKIRSCDVAFTFGENDIYMSGFQSFIIFTGIIGTILFSLFLYRLWRHNNPAGKCCIILFVGLSFISAIYFSVTMCLLLVTSFMLKKQITNCKLLNIKIF